MPISDAQFKRFLRGKSGARLRVLAEIKFAYQTGSGPAEAAIYLADGVYTTQPTDSPPNVRYRDAIASSPSFSRAIDLAKLGGRMTTGLGSLVLHNLDGQLDFLLDVIVDGRDISFFVGDGGDAAAGIAPWARSDFRLVGMATIGAVKSDDNQATIELRDRNFKLDVTLVGATIASGPNAGKPKPINVGYINNFDLTPYLLDATTLKYYLNDFPMAGTMIATTSGVIDVRDSGASLGPAIVVLFGSGSLNTLTANAATDTLTLAPAAHGLADDDVVWFTNHTGAQFPASQTLVAPITNFTQYWVIASGLTANNFKLSLTRGGAAIDITSSSVDSGAWDIYRNRFFIDGTNATLQLSSAPAGRVTMDTYVIASSGLVAGTTPHDAFLYYLQNYAPRLAASDYDQAAIVALAAAEASTGTLYGRSILDRMNLLEILDEIALGTQSWYGSRADGVLTVGKLDLANLDGVSPIDAIDANDIDGTLECANLPLPWGRVVVDADVNVVQQTDGLVNSVSATNRSRWAQKFATRTTTTDPAGTDYAGNWWDYHKSAIDSAPIELACITGGNGSVPANIQPECDAITALFRPWTRSYRCTVGLDKYALNPGDCVTLTYPRFGLAAGKRVRVISVQPRFSDQAVDLVLVRQATPDFLSTTH
jgi:hypothetical protein